MHDGQCLPLASVISYNSGRQLCVQASEPKDLDLDFVVAVSSKVTSAL